MHYYIMIESCCSIALCIDLHCLVNFYLISSTFMKNNNPESPTENTVAYIHKFIAF